MSEHVFPSWDELPETVRLKIEACGGTKEMYDNHGDSVRASQLWFASWDDLTPEIRKRFVDGGVDKVEFEASQAEKDSMGLCASLEPRGAESKEMREIIERGWELEYNRQVAEWAVDELALDHIHVLDPILVHRHLAGQVTEPHMRCHVFLALRSKPNDFTEAVIDVEMDLFNKLEPVSDVKQRLGLPVTGGEWQRFLQQFWQTVESGAVDPMVDKHLVVIGTRA